MFIDPDDEIIRELELAGVCCFPEIDQPNFAALPLEAAKGDNDEHDCVQ